MRKEELKVERKKFESVKMRLRKEKWNSNQSYKLKKLRKEERLAESKIGFETAL